MRITSPAFANGDNIPEKYTGDGENINPPLHVEDVPQGTKSFALIAEDPDAPRGIFKHWAVWNIPPDTKDLSEGASLQEAMELENDFGDTGYGGPCPPSGTHRYYFRIFALDSDNLPAPRKAKDALKAMTGHVLAEASLMGRYAHH
ncbi:YbhB/YbcL family Raf kinase inhibitor-like protein [Verrucomicrobiota bacterium sgz303538]